MKVDMKRSMTKMWCLMNLSIKLINTKLKSKVDKFLDQLRSNECGTVYKNVCVSDLLSIKSISTQK